MTFNNAQINLWAPASGHGVATFISPKVERAWHHFHFHLLLWVSAHIGPPVNQYQRGRKASSPFRSGPSINYNHSGKKKPKSHCPTQCLSFSSWSYLWPCSPLFPHLTSGAKPYGGSAIQRTACGRQNNGSTKDILVLIPKICNYVRLHDVKDQTVSPKIHMSKLVTLWYTKKHIRGPFIQFWHRAPKTLVIFWVILVIGTSFVVIFGLSLQFLTQELLRPLESP